MPRKNRGICVFVSKFLNRLEEKIRKESRHPERSEGSPDAMEMSRKARHDVLLWEQYKGYPYEREIPHCIQDDELHQEHCGLTIQG